MVCLSWWAIVLAIAAAVVVGFVLYFAWSWWLLSRPDPRNGPR
jgi:hypothetical protein